MCSGSRKKPGGAPSLALLQAPQRAELHTVILAISRAGSEVWKDFRVFSKAGQGGRCVERDLTYLHCSACNLNEANHPCTVSCADGGLPAAKSSVDECFLILAYLPFLGNAEMQARSAKHPEYPGISPCGQSPAESSSSPRQLPSEFCWVP